MPQVLKFNRKNTNWYQMVAKGKTVEISIYEEIGVNWWGEGLTAKKFEKQLRDFGDVEGITLRINSPGGSVFDGNAIYNILRSHKAHVHTIIDGVAASIASVIALSGDTIEMPENAMIMIHNPMNGVFGNSVEMRQMADRLDKIRDSILNVYESKTELGRDKLANMMDAETWMTADEAVELGFADKVTKAVKAVASISPEAFAMFSHPPMHLLQAVPSNVKEQKEDEPMSVQNPTPPSAGQVTMTQAELDAAIQKGVAAQLNPQLQKMNEDRLNSIRMRFAALVSESKITPAQSKVLALLAENLMAVDAQVKFSLAEDGSNEVAGSPVDALFALAETMSHSLLKEQVAAADTNAGGEAVAAGQPVKAVTAKNWKPDLKGIPDEQKKCPSGFVMDQFIKQVIMPANPGMKYADAALLAEKDPDLQVILDQYGYIPDA